MKQIIIKFIQNHKIAFGLMVIALVISGYYGYRSLKGTTADIRYVLAEVTKGTLVSSISGSGQVSALDQIDVKAKVSGDITGLYVVKGQSVKKGQLLAVIDDRNAKRAVSEAEINLESAKIQLDSMISLPGSSLLQAENALAQAKLDLEKAETIYENIDSDIAKNLQQTYEDGYSNVSSAFFKLSDYMQDLKEVLGTDTSEEANINGYGVIIGKDSIFIKKLLEDYYKAKDLYNKNFTFFRGVFSNDDSAVIYKLLADTLETERSVSKALESARHMYDAVMAVDYDSFNIAPVVIKMQPKIETDLTSIFSNISSLQKTIDTIDGVVEDSPNKIKDAEIALKSAQQKLQEKQLAYENAKNGAGSNLDIRNQKNIVAQKEFTLADAQQQLSDHYIRAPFEGVVAAVNIKKGDSVSGSLFTLITKKQIAEITLNEVDIAKVKVGQKATLTFDAVENLSLTGEVAEVDSLGSVSQGVVNYNIQIIFDAQDERVKPGMSVSASIITDVKQDVLMAPSTAIKFSGDISYIEMLENLTASQLSASAINSAGINSATPPKQQAVEIGLSNDSMTEITNGLKEGDKIITRTINSTTQTTSSSQNSLFKMGSSGSSGNRATGGFMEAR